MHNTFADFIRDPKMRRFVTEEGKGTYSITTFIDVYASSIKVVGDDCEHPSDRFFLRWDDLKYLISKEGKPSCAKMARLLFVIRLLCKDSLLQISPDTGTFKVVGGLDFPKQTLLTIMGGSMDKVLNILREYKSRRLLDREGYEYARHVLSFIYEYEDDPKRPPF